MCGASHTTLPAERCLIVRCRLENNWAAALIWSTAGDFPVYVNPIYRYRMGRFAWSLLRRPAKSREFPEKHERLVTADELLRFGI